MARLPRYFAAGLPQHVIQRGNNRSVLFAADSDFLFFRDCLAEACGRHACQVHAYVFMTNHVHLVMTPLGDNGISKVMQSVGRRYVQHFNTRYDRTGTLWEGRYRATPIEKDRYLLACYRYVEMNPVRAGLVGDPADYPWSSYRANAFGVRDPIVVAHDLYSALGPHPDARRLAYRSLFDVGLTYPTLEAIREATNKGWALGTERFREEVAALLERRATPLRALRRARVGMMN